MNNPVPAIVQADNKFYLDFTCVEEDGSTPRDLTGATVTAKLRINNGTANAVGAAVQGLATAGVIRVTLLSTDIPSSGSFGFFEIQLKAVWTDGTVKHSSVYRDHLHKLLS